MIAVIIGYPLHRLAALRRELKNVMQTVKDGPSIIVQQEVSHYQLGEVSFTSEEDVCRHLENSQAMRSIRTLGPNGLVTIIGMQVATLGSLDGLTEFRDNDEMRNVMTNYARSIGVREACQMFLVRSSDELPIQPAPPVKAE